MVVALYLAHGVSTRTSTALFGTVLGIVITGVLAAWMTSWANLGIAYSEDGYLLVDTTDLAMTDIIVCAILITGLGVLNDVTITQASALWELAAAAPRMKPGQLFSRAMLIGRDHIASTVYTITFAYVGSALMTLIIVSAHPPYPGRRGGQHARVLHRPGRGVPADDRPRRARGQVGTAPDATERERKRLGQCFGTGPRWGRCAAWGGWSALDPSGGAAARTNVRRPGHLVWGCPGRRVRRSWKGSELRPGLREDAADDLLHLVEFALAHRQRRRALGDRVAALLRTAAQAAFGPPR